MYTEISVVADGTTDNTAAINAAMADPNTTTGVLPPGVIGVGSSVIVPSNKTLFGSGRGQTTIKALPTFSRAVSGGVVSSPPTTNSTNIRLADFKIDANKVGLGGGDANRLHGWILSGPGSSQILGGFSVERVDVVNATGYAHFSRWAEDGVVRDCTSADSHIHFEQLACRRILVDNCRASAGTGAGVVPCASMFHPVAASNDITFNGCTGTGTAVTGLDITMDEGPSSRIRFLNGNIDITGYGIRVLGNHAVDHLLLAGSRFRSTSGLSFYSIVPTSGKVSGCVFAGTPTAIQLGTSTSVDRVEFDQCDVIATGGPGTATYGVRNLGQGTVIWSNGTLTVGTAGGQDRYVTTGNVYLTLEATKCDPVLPYVPQRIRQRLASQAPIVVHASGSSSTTAFLPLSVVDPAKVHFSFAVKTPSNVGHVTPVWSATWRIFEDNRIQVFFLGTNLSAYVMTYEFIELL